MKDRNPKGLENILLISGAVAVVGVTLAVATALVGGHCLYRGYRKIKEAYSPEPPYSR